MNHLVRYVDANYLTLRIINAARAVYNILGPGFAEEKYRKAISNELKRIDLDVQQLFPVDVWQSGELVELLFLDLFIEWHVIVEVIASQKPIDNRQRFEMNNSLEPAGADLGLLINFGRQKLEIEPVFHGA